MSYSLGYTCIFLKHLPALEKFSRNALMFIYFFFFFFPEVGENVHLFIYLKYMGFLTESEDRDS